MNLPDIVRWLEAAPRGTTLSAESVLELLRDAETTDHEEAVSVSPASWRERLWTVPPETRLGVAELSQAIGRPRSWIYRHTSRASGLPLLPHAKLDGELVFTASEIRAWLAQHEETVVAPLSGVVPITRRARRERHA